MYGFSNTGDPKQQRKILHKGRGERNNIQIGLGLENVPCAQAWGVVGPTSGGGGVCICGNKASDKANKDFPGKSALPSDGILETTMEHWPGEKR